MSKRPTRRRASNDTLAGSATAQGALFPAEPRTNAAPDSSRTSPTSPPAYPVRSSPPKVAARKTIQDLLIAEGLAAVKMSETAESLSDLHQRIAADFKQNSRETRTRYAQSVLKWFFPDGLGGLAHSAWLAYRDERIEMDLLRYLYLAAEPVMGLCVSEALFPLQNGMQIPATYFDRFLRNFFREDPPDKTKCRLKSNLMHLGFLDRTRGKSDRLQSVVFDRTSLLILVHYLFAPDQP